MKKIILTALLLVMICTFAPAREETDAVRNNSFGIGPNLVLTLGYAW